MAKKTKQNTEVIMKIPIFFNWCYKWEEMYADLQLTVFIHRQITRFQILQRGKKITKWIKSNLPVSAWGDE